MAITNRQRIGDVLDHVAGSGPRPDQRFGSGRFEEDQADYQAQTEETLAVQVDTAGLPPWPEVVEPHDDVARGEFGPVQFAADLRPVAQGRSESGVSDPTQFFPRTQFTRTEASTSPNKCERSLRALVHVDPRSQGIQYEWKTMWAEGTDTTP